MGCKHGNEGLCLACNANDLMRAMAPKPQDGVACPLCHTTEPCNCECPQWSCITCWEGHARLRDADSEDGERCCECQIEHRAFKMGDI